MPRRRIIVLQDDKDWNQYLIEAFEDTPSTPEIVPSAQKALPLIRQGNPDVVFTHPKLLTQPLIAALKAHRSSHAEFKIFRLGPISDSPPPYPFDEGFDEIPPTLFDFQKRLVQHLPLPNPLRILVIDDEPEIGEIFRDYLENRTEPAFIVETARDGLEGAKKLEGASPDVLILDIKMPKKDGRELYRELKNEGRLPPTIVFFDIVSAEEVLEIRRLGNPAFVEKGSRSSRMPEMSALIKKMAYFG